MDVKIVDANGGMGSGEQEGVTHQDLEDRFSESGTPDELYEKYGIARENIVNKAIAVL